MGAVAIFVGDCQSILFYECMIEMFYGELTTLKVVGLQTLYKNSCFLE